MFGNGKGEVPGGAFEAYTQGMELACQRIMSAQSLVEMNDRHECTDNENDCMRV